MTYFKFVIFLLSVSITISCSDDLAELENTEEFLIIGLTYGECGGDCSHLYKLEDGQIFQDTEATWWQGSDQPSFSDMALDNQTALEELKTLSTTFPNYLTESTEEFFGCPDCGDWGALHVIIIEDGEERKWTLDNMIESNPEEIQAWTLKMQTLIYDIIQ